MEGHVEHTWMVVNHKHQTKYPPEWVHDFGFDMNDRTQETLAGVNNKTFTRDLRWIDADRTNGLYWRRSGLTTFDFKGKKFMGRAPDGPHQLIRKHRGYTVVLNVNVERAFINLPELVERGEAAGVGQVVYSKNCGRAVLSFVSMTITPPHHTRRTRSHSRRKVARKKEDSDDDSVRSVDDGEGDGW